MSFGVPSRTDELEAMPNLPTDPPWIRRYKVTAEQIEAIRKLFNRGEATDNQDYCPADEPGICTEVTNHE